MTEAAVTEPESPPDPHVSIPPPEGGPTAAWRRALPWVLLAGAVALWVVRGPGGEGQGLPSGMEAPPLAVASSDGPLDLAQERGRVVVLSFWATWCPACRAEGPILSRVADRLAASGDAVYGVSVDRMSLEQVTGQARELGMTFPIALGDRALADRFGVQLLPTVYVIGPEGRIANAFTGTVSEARLLRAVEAARTPELALRDPLVR